MAKSNITKQQVTHVADLANIPVSDTELSNLTDAFQETLEVVDKLRQIEVNDAEPTHQVTGLENVFREDEVDEPRMLTQQEALTNATQTHQGYFVVPRIIAEK